jgi:transposase-like protein
MAEEVKAAQAPEVKPAVEKQTNCLGCGKPLRKIKTYYRDGKYYCAKKCWKTFLDKSKAEAAQIK